MARPDLDIVGTAAVDVVPIAPQFHTKLKTIVLPAADRVGEDAGRRIGDAISRNIVVAIPDAVTTGGRRAQAAATREGGQVGGAFGRSVKRKLEEAFRSLPRADVRLGDAGLNADIDRLRARIQTLSGKTIGIDIDEGAALREIEAIDAALARLAAENPNVQVRTDTAAARAALAAVQAQINDVDRDDVNIRVDVDTAGAMSALRALGIALAGVAAIPIVPVGAAALGSIASAAVAAGAGVGALALAAVPAIRGVTQAIQAKSAAEKQAATSTDSSAASNVKAAQTALQLASAQAQLSSAHRQAAQAVEQANRQVAYAERSLADAKRASRQAEEDLTAARKDAADQLRDLNDRLLDGKLDEREATLRVQEAQAELNKVLADPTSTDLQKERARLSYDEAVRGAQKAKTANDDLQKQVVAANKAGVDGSKEVQDAQERARQATQKGADQERALADARAKVHDAEVQGAEAVASAERGLQAARLSSVDTTSKSTTATDTYRQALAKLTPEQRDLYDAVAGPKGITAAFKDWSAPLSPDVVPLLTRAVNGAKSALPGLTPLVKAAADAVGVLFDDASRELKTPFWRDFKRDIDSSAKPAIIGFGRTFGNVLKGAAGVVDAFLPHVDGIADRMVRSSRRFADWGTSLKGSPAFESFLKYSAEHGPLIADTIGKIAGAVLNVGAALSPLSGPLLKLLGGVAEAIGIIADKAPWFILLVYGIITAVKLWTLAQVALNLVMSANPLVLIGLAILALVGVVIYAWNHFDGFRNAILTAWKWITDATTWAWENVLQPVFSAIGDIVVWLWRKILKPHIDFVVGIFNVLADVVTWLWTGIFSPIFGFIGDLIVWWWKNIVKKQFDAVIRIVKDVGASFKWLYDKGIKPHIDSISDAVSWVWKKGISPAFKNIRDGIGLVADSFRDAKDRIAKSWGDVARVAIAPVNWVIDKAYTHGLKALFDKVSKYVGMDPLPAAPKLQAPPKKFADGGRTSGGTPGVDSIPILAMADEFIIKRSSARKIGFDKLAYMNATGEIPRFADGGIVGALGDAFDWTTNKISGAVDWAKTAADLISNPSKIWGQLVRPILASVTQRLAGSDLNRTLAKYPVRMANGLKDAIVDAVTFGGGGAGDLGAHGASAKQAQNIARAMLPSFGWGPEQMAPLIKLWNGESGWRWNALNASSGAYGIPQALPAVKMASAGADWRTNAATQIRWGLGYIKNRPDYGSPSAAWSKWLSRSPHWYDDGGYLPPGLNLVANGTGRPEPVFTSQQFADIRAAKGGGGAITVNVESKTYLDGREIGGFVDQRIEVHDADVASDINAGRYV